MRQQRKEVTLKEGLEGLSKGLQRIGKGLDTKLDNLGDLGRALIELDEGGKEVEENLDAKLVLRKTKSQEQEKE